MLFKRFLSVSPVVLQALKPKRPPSPFSYYFKQNLKKIVEEHNVKTTEAMKIASEQWKSISDSDKEGIAEALRPAYEKYRKERELYEKSLPPKKPTSSFGIFLKEKSPEKRAANPALTQSEIMKIVSSEWNTLDSGIKQTYRKRYDDAYAEFLKAKSDIAA